MTRLRTERLRMHQQAKMINIFDPNAKFAITTKYTTILASGPNGIKGWDILEKIPREDNTIIAVNFALVYGWRFNRPYIVPDFSGITDKRALMQEAVLGEGAWFPAALTQFQGKLLFNTAVVMECYNKYKYPGPYYFFKSKGLMNSETVKLSSDMVHTGGSVTCSMAQIWGNFIKYRGPGEPILLINGADMSGDEYAVGKNSSKAHGQTWNSVVVLGKMCQLLNKRKGKVYATSITKLHDAGYIDYYPGVIIDARPIESGIFDDVLQSCSILS